MFEIKGIIRLIFAIDINTHRISYNKRPWDLLNFGTVRCGAN